MKIETIVKAFIAQHRLLDQRKKYLVALSGGADSVALLLLLSGMGYDVEAAHCNFKLRGKESDRDEFFCQSLCQKLQIPFHTIHFDTLSYAELHKISIEMAARELRYHYFENLRKDLDMEGICVAHHNDDNVETLLINLIRGTGFNGLTGMSPQNNRVLRPLLCINRSDIELYLERKKQDYVTDSTNLTTDFTRNKIRLELIPLLQQINSGAVCNISKTITRLNEASKLLNTTLETLSTQLVHRVFLHGTQCISVSINALLQTPSPEYVLFYIIQPFGFTPAQVEQIASHLHAHTGKHWVSATHTLVIDRGMLLIEPTLAPEELSREMRIPEEGVYVFASHKTFRFTSGIIEAGFAPGKQPHLVHLDKAKVVFPLILRHLHTGDRFVPFGMNASRLISDYLTDRKRSFFDKQHQLVLTDAHNRILWLVGERTDNRFRIENNSEVYLQIEVLGDVNLTNK